MENEKVREVWQRGPVAGVPGLLQPVTHALLQAAEEITTIIHGLDEALLWVRPGGLASAGFHLQHMSGVIDRLFTYARNEKLNQQQLEWLATEGKEDKTVTTEFLVDRFEKTVGDAIIQLKNTRENSLTDFRGIGRAQIPSTQIGLLFHAAEHTMRHLGQLLVTVKFVQAIS